MVMYQQIRKLLQETANLNTQINQQNEVPPVSIASINPPIEEPLFHVGLYESKRRHRKTANEVERHYKCPVPQCDKAYGSEGTLSQHVKLKHPSIYYSKPAGDGIPTPSF